jgi:ribonuclease VapC
MIIDTSAIIAILRDEPEAKSCARAITDATIRRVSTLNFVESAVVIDACRVPIATRPENGGGPGVRLHKRQRTKKPK